MAALQPRTQAPSPALLHERLIRCQATRRLGRGRSTGEQSCSRESRRRSPASWSWRRWPSPYRPATGHPEECATAAAWSTADGGYSPYLSWQGAEESVCASKSVTSRYDDSDAKLTRRGRGRDGRPEADRLARRSTAPFDAESGVQLRPRVRERLRLPGQLRGRHDLRRPRPGEPDRSPGRSCARARRTTSRSTTGSWSRRPTRAAPTTSCSSDGDRRRRHGADHLGGPEGLRRARPGGARGMLTQRARRTAARTPTRAARGATACSSTSSPTTSSGSNYRCANAGPPHDKISIVEIPKANPAAAKVVNDAGAVPGRRQPGRAGRHAARDHRLPRHHRLPEDRPRGRRLHRRGRDHRHQGPGQPEGASPPSRIRTSRSGTAPRSARTARRSCSPTSSAAAARRRATRRSARTAAPTRSTTSPIPRIRSS